MEARCNQRLPYEERVTPVKRRPDEIWNRMKPQEGAVIESLLAPIISSVPMTKACISWILRRLAYSPHLQLGTYMAVS